MKRLLILLGLALSTGAAAARPIVVFLSDFGTGNEAAAICHGVILSIDSDIAVVDLTHGIPPFDLVAAGAALERATTFPPGTVFVSVIDPGVGTTRRAVAVRTRDDRVFVAPDNGLLTPVLSGRGVQAAVILDPARVNPAWRPGTFDGRDLFAPAAARLALGTDLGALGSPIDSADIVHLAPSEGAVLLGPGKVRGTYVRTDEPYGNVWTDIPDALLRQAGISLGARLEILIGETRVVAPLVQAFGDVPPEQPLAYLNSEGRLALAINLGDFRERLGVQEGATITVTWIATPSAR